MENVQLPVAQAGLKPLENLDQLCLKFSQDVILVFRFEKWSLISDKIDLMKNLFWLLFPVAPFKVNFNRKDRTILDLDLFLDLDQIGMIFFQHHFWTKSLFV